MNYISSLEELHTHYGTPGDAAIKKVADRVTPEYRAWIERSRFCILSTVGPSGTDASPRGDDGPVVRELDEFTLAMPDWRGNARLDSLRNIVRNSAVSLMFMVPGANNVIRLNGSARVTAEPEMAALFDKNGRRPATVIVIKVGELYSQCARALIRSNLWSGEDDSEGLPTVGDILSAMTNGSVGGKPYDDAWPERAAKSMW